MYPNCDIFASLIPYWLTLLAVELLTRAYIVSLVKSMIKSFVKVSCSFKRVSIVFATLGS